MCTFMNLPPYGADAFLRFKLRSHIRDIQVESWPLPPPLPSPPPASLQEPIKGVHTLATAHDHKKGTPLPTLVIAHFPLSPHPSPLH